MEEIDDKFPLFEMLKIHEFAWFPKIKTLTASCFLQNIYFFLNFWKKLFFFMKIVRFCQKPKAMRFCIFCAKNKKEVLGTKSVTKFRKIEVNSRENQANSWVSGLGINVNVFFIFSFFEKWLILKWVFEKTSNKYRKIVLNWSKSSRFEHV